MSVVFNHVKDTIGTHWQNASGSGTPRLIATLHKAANLQDDATLADHTTLAAVIAANAEADFTGPNGGNYVRKTFASTSRTVQNANDRVLLGFAAPGTVHQISWNPAGGSAQNQLLAMIISFVPQPGTSADSAILPLVSHDIGTRASPVVTDGTELVVSIHADGSVRLRNP